MAKKKEYVTIVRDGLELTYPVESALAELRVLHGAREDWSKIDFIVTEMTKEEYEKIKEYPAGMPT
jgi:hypothetical protein